MGIEASKFFQQAQEATDFVRERSTLVPRAGLVLGSGWGTLVEALAEVTEIPYQEIPHFPRSTVSWHAGSLWLGKLDGLPTAVMQGRFHPYEGFSHMEAAFPVVVLRNLGVETLIVTNASGAINRDYNAGELMLITDHINFQGDNPLTGIEETDDLTRFPDMTYAYTPDLQRLALEVAEEAGIHLHEGVYVAFRGPSFETPAEIQMAGAWGADAVGMSSVPEVIMARALGMEVLGISCLSNMAAGILPQPLSTEEVMDVAEKVLPTMVDLIRGVARRLAG